LVRRCVQEDSDLSIVEGKDPMTPITKLNSVLRSVAIAFLVGTSMSHLLAQEKCSVEILTPLSGVTVQENTQVKGTASFSPGRFLWVFAHRKGLALWWPQGAGSAVVTSGRWEVMATLGQDRDVGREFEIVAAVVDASTNQDLLAWFKRAEESGNNQGINLPSTVGECRIAATTVMKTR
jgi:hypothetical protein